MAEFTFKQTQEIAVPREEIFDFFSKAENLQRITPPELDFHIVTPTPVIIEKGAIIDYELKLYGFPITWRSEITIWDPPNEFADTQLSGPYKQWVHTHRFSEPSAGVTLMEDEVHYRLPFEPFGDLAQFLVDRQLNYIFEHRRRSVEELLRKK